MPTIDNPTLSKTTLTSIENVILTASLSDAENDQIQYRILVNGTEKVPLTPLANPPITIEYTVNFSDLIGGNNTVTIEAIDSKGEISTWNGIITVQEHDAEIIITYPSITAPKNTDIEFPFEIKAPFYANKEVTKDVEVVDNGTLGNGKMFTVNVSSLKPMFKSITNITIN